MKIITFENVPLGLLLQIGCEVFPNGMSRRIITNVLLKESSSVVEYINWIRMNSISRITYLQRETTL